MSLLVFGGLYFKAWIKKNENKKVIQKAQQLYDRSTNAWYCIIISAVVDTTFVDIYVDTKNIPTCRYNLQHIDKRTMEKKMSIIMWEAAMSYATTSK